MDFKSSKKILLRLVSVAVGIALMAYLYSKTDGEFTALVTSMNFETLVILISAYSGILIIDERASPACETEQVVILALN